MEVSRTGIDMRLSTKRFANVIIADTLNGEAMSEFKTAGGKTVRILNADVYRKASASAGKKLREITGKREFTDKRAK